MKRRERLLWWLYVVIGALLCFVVPYLMSARDDFMVITGLALIVGYGVYSWEFWVSPLLKLIKEKAR